MFVALFLARRGLRESLLSTGLTIAAVAVGIGFEVPAAANLRGYRAELLAQSLDSGSGDVRVHPRRGSFIRDADRLAARLGRIPGVTEATPVVGAPASVNGHGHSASLGILGVEPRAAYHPYRLISGHPLGDRDRDGILLGSSIAQRLEVAVGDQVVARAIINEPPLVLADEPTGSLDSEAADAVLDAFGAICLSGTALLVVTHDPSVAARCSRRLAMRDGRIHLDGHLPPVSLAVLG